MLEGLFRSESLFWRGVGRVTDIIILNLLWIAFTVPLVSAGAALAALHECARRISAEEGGSVVRMYVRSVRSNLWPSAVLWLLTAPALVALCAAWYVFRMAGAIPLLLVLTLVVLPVWIYVWPLQARFDNPPLRTLQLAFLLAFGNPGWTALLLVTDAVLAGIAIATWYLLPGGLPLVGLLGYSFAVFAHTPVIERVFRPYVDAGRDSRSRP